MVPEVQEPAVRPALASHGMTADEAIEILHAFDTGERMNYPYRKLAEAVDFAAAILEAIVG